MLIFFSACSKLSSPWAIAPINTTVGPSLEIPEDSEQIHLERLTGSVHSPENPNLIAPNGKWSVTGFFITDKSRSPEEALIERVSSNCTRIN